MSDEDTKFDASAEKSRWSFSPPRLRPLVRLGLLGALALNLAATSGLTFVSANNYPGGEVWRALEELQAESSRLSQLPNADGAAE